MFELVSFSFVMSLSLNLLLVGALYYYFNLRFKHLETALIQQNKVLADFISHVKSNVTNQLPAGGASQEALEASKEFVENPSNEKINVSDNEGSDSEEESDEESDGESEDESVDKDTKIVELTTTEPITEPTEESTAEPTAEDLQTLISSQVTQELQIDPISALLSVEPDMAKSGIVIISNSVENIESADNIDNNLDNNLNILNLEDIDDLNKFNLLEEQEENTETVSDYSKYKVSELKQLALEKGINITGKKKTEIIALLTSE